jgi:hypothetical protein
MATWTRDELDKIDKAEELEIAPLRRDGTQREPVTIWVVRIDDELYVRSVNGRSASWFRGSQVRHEGRISAGGVEKEVTFTDTDPYQARIVDSIVTPKARSATIRLLPR